MKVCVQWPRLGPYHVARLRATLSYFEARGSSLVALETAAQDGLYAWREETGALPFDRVQVFQGQNFHAISPAALHKGVQETLDRLDPDVVAIHSYGFPDARAALLWCRRNKRRAVLMTDSRAEDAPRQAAREWIKRRIVGQYDTALVAGQPHVRYLTSLGFERARIHTGYDVVDNAYFANAALASIRDPERWKRLPGFSSPTPFFLASNRFIGRKNLDTLLYGYHLYRQRAADPWRLVLLGDGPLRPALEHLIDTLGLEGVTLAGFRQIEELPAYYARASAFVHTALADQWALVVNEAMACGLPVILSKGTGCAEDLVVEGRNGFTFDTLDPEDLTARLIHISAPSRDLQRLRQESLRLIADWGLERFATGLYEACVQATELPPRARDVAVDMLFTGMSRVLRRVDSLHTVES